MRFRQIRSRLHCAYQSAVDPVNEIQSAANLQPAPKPPSPITRSTKSVHSAVACVAPACMDRRLLGAMKAFTSSVLVAVLSIVLLATHVATQIPSDCHAEFLLEVADLYSNDQSCARALAALVTSTTSDPCSASDKDTIGDCLKVGAPVQCTHADALFAEIPRRVA